MESFTKYTPQVKVDFQSLGFHCHLIEQILRVRPEKITFYLFFYTNFRRSLYL